MHYMQFHNSANNSVDLICVINLKGKIGMRLITFEMLKDNVKNLLLIEQFSRKYSGSII